MKTQKGFSAVVVLLALLLISIVGFSGYYIWHTQQNQETSETQSNITNTPKDSSPKPSTSDQKVITASKTDQELIDDALLSYCKNDYKNGWQEYYKVTIDDSSITAGVSQLTLKNERASGSAYCDTTELTNEQKFSGFKAYFKKVNNTWTYVTKSQMAPGCSTFDGDNWPPEVVPYCYGNDGQTRTPY